MEQSIPVPGQHGTTHTDDDGHQHLMAPGAERARQEPLLPPSANEPVKSRPLKQDKGQQNGAKGHLSSSWWWWEIGGAIVAVVSLFVIIAVLAVLDKKPIDDWKYNIQPSSLLSTLTTVGKTGMMLVVASCVSQLKWVHFQHPNRLSHLEVYDEVSRGSPIGSANMLWKIGRTLLRLRLDIIAGLFAIITLASLAIDPMIQQILAVRQQDLQLKNLTATIGASDMYTSKTALVIPENTFANNISCMCHCHPYTAVTDFVCLIANQTGVLVYQMTLLNQLNSAPIKPDLSCPSPSTRCTFKNLTALGLCRDYSDVTEISNRTCKAYAYPASLLEQFTPTPPAHYINCTYEIKGVATKRNLTINFGGPYGYTYDGFRSILDVIDTSTAGVIDEPSDIARMVTIRVDGGVESDTFLRNTSLPVPKAQLAIANWYWCEQFYNDISLDQRDGTLTNMTSTSTSPLLVSVIETDSDPNTWTFSSNKTKRDYTTNFLIPQFMDHFFLTDVKFTNLIGINATGDRDHYTYDGGQGGRGDSGLENYTPDLFGMAPFMSTTNISAFAQNVANAVTNQVLTSADNINFTSAPGIAFVNTTYYHVRWAWLVLPLLEAVATAVLLIATMVINRMPLVKSSSIALLAHGPEDAVEYRVDGLETTKKWEALGASFRVMWMEDEKGWMRLIKA